MTVEPCPICAAPHGFHEDECSSGPMPEHLRHLSLPLHGERRDALRDALPRCRPSDEEIARLRAVKGRTCQAGDGVVTHNIAIGREPCEPA